MVTRSRRCAVLLCGVIFVASALVVLISPSITIAVHSAAINVAFLQGGVRVRTPGDAGRAVEIYWNSSGWRWLPYTSTHLALARNGRDYVPTTSVFVPLWPAAVGSAMAGLWIIGRRRARPSPDACSCGYSLTGNQSGRCPECGARRVAGESH